MSLPSLKWSISTKDGVFSQRPGYGVVWPRSSPLLNIKRAR